MNRTIITIDDDHATLEAPGEAEWLRSDSVVLLDDWA